MKKTLTIAAMAICASTTAFANGGSITPPPPQEPPSCDCASRWAATKQVTAGIAAFAAIDFIGDGTFQTGFGVSNIGGDNGIAGAVLYNFGKGIYGKVGMFSSNDGRPEFAGAVMLSW